VIVAELRTRLVELGVELVAEVPAPPRTFVWPAQLPSLGIRRLGVFTGCGTCGLGTWVQYGAQPRCWRCAGREAASGTTKDMLCKISDHVDQVGQVQDGHVVPGEAHLAVGVVSDEVLAKVLTGNLAAAWRGYAQSQGLDEALTQAGLEALGEAEP
jgi:hypothetical protein